VKVVFSAVGVKAPAVEAPARRGILAVLKGGGVKGRGELNVAWVTRRRLRALGKKFRNADKFTDVISFRYESEPFPMKGEVPPFGDLYISPDQARMNARRFGVRFEEECVRLCVHGALHLLGHRDYKPAERKRMWGIQEPIVRRLMKGAS
jgi:probable rRNA maturation factor